MAGARFIRSTIIISLHALLPIYPYFVIHDQKD